MKIAENAANAAKDCSAKVKIRWLPKSGLSVFITSGLLLLVICFLDYASDTITFVPPYFKHLLFMVFIYSILTLSLNFVSGYIGQVSLGHAAFYGIGAYTSALLTLNLHWNYWLAFLAAGILAALFGIPLGLPALRVKGNFLVVITYGFAEVLRYIAINSNITGGPAGLPGLPTPSFITDFANIGPSGQEAFLIVGFLLASFLAFFMTKLESSRVGYAFSAIREDEIAALSMGININYYKLLAFMLSAFFAGLAGSLYASYARFVSPDMLASDQSILILTMVVVGGARSIKGSFVGAALLTLIPEILHSLKDVVGLPFDPWLIIYGLILILMMKFRPQGIWGSSSLFSK